MAPSMDFRPQTLDLRCYAGDTVGPLTVTMKDPALIGGRVFAAEVRAKHDDVTAAAVFDVEQTADGCVLTLDAGQTAMMDGFTGFWDCQLSDGLTTTTVVRGQITFDADVTQ